MNLREELDALARDMGCAIDRIGAQPDDREWTMPETDALESARHAALRLAAEIEAVFEALLGAPRQKEPR